MELTRLIEILLFEEFLSCHVNRFLFLLPSRNRKTDLNFSLAPGNRLMKIIVKEENKLGETCDLFFGRKSEL